MTHRIDDQKLTPAMRQYHHFKGQYPDAILFFRMGDFYETFHEDARTCARVLGIALTSRSKGDSAIPLAGVPHHAVDGYLKKMIQAGYKVAICEQVEDAALAKGLVKRDVVRLVTPGTLTEDSLLDERSGNYLAAVGFAATPTGKASGKAPAAGVKSPPAGLAWVDLSTGRFFAQSLEAGQVPDELGRLGAAEILISEEADALPDSLARQLAAAGPIPLTRRPGWAFDPDSAARELAKQFGTAGLEGFGFDRPDLSIGAAGAILDYLQETQKTALGHITQIQRVRPERFLQLDQTTLRSLEILRTLRDNSRAGSLLAGIDQTVTAMGARLLRLWLCYPLNDLAEIEARLDAVAELVQLDTVREPLRQALQSVADIERIASRISTGRASPRDLLGLKEALRQLPRIRSLLDQCSGAMLTRLAAGDDELENLADLIEAAIDPQAGLSIRDGGIIRAGYHEEVDRLRSFCRDGQSWLANYQNQLIEQTGIPTLKVGFNKLFGYYVEISNAHRDKAPPGLVRKQTLKNAERYITDELKRYEGEALTSEDRCKRLEEQLFGDVRGRIAEHIRSCQQAADAVARIDVLAALAHVARHRNYCRPQVHTGRDLHIVEARHPVLDQTLAERFVPNDVSLGGGAADLAILTGPNMSGKSTYIRQTALLVILAQTGSFIPARSASIGLVDRIFTRVGASDELARGQSTFMVEMIETANILNNATERSLVILDEIGRGTSTYDGLALAWAITEYLAGRTACRTLFATHYHEITELADLLKNVTNLNVAVREWKDEVVFLHKIAPGRTDKSYGIHVARLAGIPKEVLTRSREILEELESSFAREARAPQLAGRRTAPAADQMTLFDMNPSDPLLEKLRQIDLDNLTPLAAINLLHEIKTELENP